MTSSIGAPSSPIVLGQREMEDVVAQLAATFIWLGKSSIISEHQFYSHACTINSRYSWS